MKSFYWKIIYQLDIENRLRSSELRKILFNYINGGLIIPKFLVNKKFLDENKNIEMHFINLEENYKNNFSSQEIEEFIQSNEDMLKKDFIDFKYVKINPKNLLGANDYNDEFLKVIDEIDNKILNNEKIDSIAQEYDLEIKNIKITTPMIKNLIWFMEKE